MQNYLTHIFTVLLLSVYIDPSIARVNDKFQKHAIALVPAGEYQQQVHKQLSAEGGISDGGGTAVACFKSKEIADKAMDSHGRLQENYRNQIISLSTTEMFNRYISFPVERNETATDYLQRVININIRPLSERFAEKLIKSIQLVSNFESWSVKKSLPFVNDLGHDPHLQNKMDINVQCKIVQVIRRTQMSLRPIPQLRFDFDQDLFDRLGTEGFQETVDNLQSIFGNLKTLNQAILILHEAVYIMAMELKQLDSSKTRRLTSLLLDKNFFLGLNADYFSTEGRATAFADTLFATGFDFYQFLFQDLSHNPSEAVRVSEVKLERIKSYPSVRSFIDKLWQSEGMQKLFHSRYGGANPLRASMPGWMLMGEIEKMAKIHPLTPVEAFLILGYANEVRLDSLYLPELDDSDSVKRICKNAEISSRVGFDAFVPQAISYCKQLKSQQK